MRYKVYNFICLREKSYFGMVGIKGMFTTNIKLKTLYHKRDACGSKGEKNYFGIVGIKGEFSV